MAGEQDELFKQALDILKDLKRRSPKAYAKLMDRLNALSTPPSEATKTYKMSEDPEDSSWVLSMNK